MKFAEFDKAREAAAAALRGFDGKDGWPGVTEHDRAYTLPPDEFGREYTCLIRASVLSEIRPPVEVICWDRWHEEAKLVDLTCDQLAAVVEIKRAACRWVLGQIEDLPVSTCRHIRIPKELR